MQNHIKCGSKTTVTVPIKSCRLRKFCIFSKHHEKQKTIAKSIHVLSNSTAKKGLVQMFLGYSGMIQKMLCSAQSMIERFCKNG